MYDCSKEKVRFISFTLSQSKWGPPLYCTDLEYRLITSSSVISTEFTLVDERKYLYMNLLLNLLFNLGKISLFILPPFSNVGKVKTLAFVADSNACPLFLTSRCHFEHEGQKPLFLYHWMHFLIPPFYKYPFECFLMVSHSPS